MIFPRGYAIHSNLDSLFVRLDVLTLILKEKRFTGYLSVSSTDYEGVLVFFKGKLPAALDDFQGITSSGISAIKQVCSKVKEKGCSINVYTMPLITVVRLLQMGHLKLLYKDLSSTFTNINSLTDKLLQDGVSGCIDVTALNKQWMGIVFPSPDHVDVSFLWNEGKTITGSPALDRIEPLVSKTGAVFNVFSGKGKIKPKKRPAINNTPSKERLIAAWGDIIGIVERTVQPYVKEKFLYTFRAVLKEISVVYPFLHPSNGGFYYENGKASFRGSTDQLSEGLGKSLSASVSRLVAKKGKPNFSVIVKTALQPLIEKYADIVKHFSFASYCELFEITIYDRVVAVTQPFFGENTDGFLERQWLKKIDVTSENLTPEHLSALVVQLEKSAMLLISQDEVKQLCRQIEFIQMLY